MFRKGRDRDYWNNKNETWKDDAITKYTQSNVGSSSTRPTHVRTGTDTDATTATAPGNLLPASQLTPKIFDFTVDYSPVDLLATLLKEQTETKEQTESIEKKEQKAPFTVIPEDNIKPRATDADRKLAIKKTFENLEKQLEQAFKDNLQQRVATSELLATLGRFQTVDLVYDSTWQEKSASLRNGIRKEWKEIDVTRADMMKNQLREFVRMVMVDTYNIKHKGFERLHEVERKKYAPRE